MHIMTREALYELVWADPLVAVAENHQTNGPWLKKLCQDAGIPLPGVGYWSRLRAGKPVMRDGLPLRPPGADAVVTIGYPTYWWRHLSETLRDPLPLLPEFPEPIEEVAARVAAQVGSVPSIELRDTPEDRARRAAGRIIKLDGQYLRPADLRHLALSAESPFERQRFALLNSLCHGLASVVGSKPQIRIDEQAFRVRIAATEVGFTLGRAGAGPGLSLCLYIRPKWTDEGYRQVFNDEDNRPLESQLREIFVALMVAAEVQYRIAAKEHYDWAMEWRAKAEEEVRQRRAEAKRLREQRRLDQQERRRDLLFSQAEDWRTARDIRGLVADVLKEAADAMSPELLAWTQWAHQEADAIDPLKQATFLAPPAARIS